MFILPWIVYIMAFALQMVAANPNVVSSTVQVVSSNTVTSTESFIPTTLSSALKTQTTTGNQTANLTIPNITFQNKAASTTTGHQLGLLNLLDIPKPVLDWFASLFEI